MKKKRFVCSLAHFNATQEKEKIQLDKIDKPISFNELFFQIN